MACGAKEEREGEGEGERERARASVRARARARRITDPGQRLEHGDANGDAREKRRGHRDASRSRLGHGEAQLLRRNNRSALCAERAEPTPKFSERDGFPVDTGACGVVPG